jgi:hypothetical protein
MEEETLPCTLNTGAEGINVRVCSAGGEPGTTREKRHQNFSNLYMFIKSSLRKLSPSHSLSFCSSPSIQFLVVYFEVDNRTSS